MKRSVGRIGRARAIAKARSLLRRSGDPEAAEGARRYFRDASGLRFHGVKARRFREIEREIRNDLEGRWGAGDAVAFCDTMIRSRYLEEKGLGLLLLSRHGGAFDRGLLRRARSWLAGMYCDNWATTDALCGWILAPLMRARPEIIPEVVSWSASRNLWLRRASAVSLVPFARRGEMLGTVYGLAARLLDDGEDLIHKATGWLLREAGKTDARRLERFLLDHGPAVPRTALRYAIERFPEPERRRLLVATREGRPSRRCAGKRGRTAGGRRREGRRADLRRRAH